MGGRVGQRIWLERKEQGGCPRYGDRSEQKSEERYKAGQEEQEESPGGEWGGGGGHRGCFTLQSLPCY